MFVPHETNKDHLSLYAVTNAHVVRNAKTPVIRLNRKDGTTECIPTSEEQWTVHQYGDDVALFPSDTGNPPTSLHRLQETSCGFSYQLTSSLEKITETTWMP